MKLLGVILIVTGLLVSVMGYGMYANIVCHCPAQIQGQPLTCHCGEPESMFDHTLIYGGIAITASGIILFVLGWRRQKSLTGIRT